MCGGGGGGGGNDASFQANIDRDIRMQERREEQARADAATAKADKDKADTRAKFGVDITAAEQTGRQNAINYLNSRGLPPTEDSINRVVASIKSQIPDLDPSPGKYFTDEAIGSGLNTIAQGTRDRLGNTIRSTFSPGFERKLIPDTADDPFIESILGEQRGTAQQVVDFNRKRGLLNDMGYSTANQAIGTQGTSARSTLGGIGESVLGKFRQNLADIKGEAGSAASGYQYGQAEPNVGDYWGRAAAKAGTDLAGIEGSIRGAVGGTNYFDAPKALQAGGTMQGPIDLTTAGVTTPGQAPDKRDKGRGLGSSGVF